MDTIKIGEYIFEPYISNVEICKAIDLLAQKLNNDYSGKRAPLFLITLSGAMIFASELAQRLNFDPQWSFVKCTSYCDGLCSGDLTLDVAPTIGVNGEDVIVIEDIVDSGKTWAFLHNYCLKMGAKSVKVATLTFKEDAYNLDFGVDYVAMKIENRFVIGFGMDFMQLGRNLNSFYALKNS